MPKFSIVRVTPPTRAMKGEVSSGYRDAIFQATVLGDGFVVSSRALTTPIVRSMDELLYPRTSLDEPIIRDTVSAAVGESLSGLDAILERARP